MANEKIKVSVVITVLNEEQNINILLSALVKQSKKPDEVIIVDGGSLDSTASKILDFKKTNSKLELKFFVKQGNRSVSRNYGVSKAKHSWIAFTDAGCVPDEDWLAELLKSVSEDQKTEVIAGYYYGLPKTNFEKAVVPYVLVMPDRVDLDNFLPATRSMLIKKSLFQKLKGFDERLSDNEDYEFARRLVKDLSRAKSRKKIKFAKSAKVAWVPSKNLFEFSNMIFRFAKGDAQAKLWRPKVILIYLRYLLFLFLIYINIYIFAFLFIGYLVWSILKNKKYVGNAWYYLPILQLTSDFAIMLASIIGFIAI